MSNDPSATSLAASMSLYSLRKHSFPPYTPISNDIVSSALAAAPSGGGVHVSSPSRSGSSMLSKTFSTSRSSSDGVESSVPVDESSSRVETMHLTESGRFWRWSMTEFAIFRNTSRMRSPESANRRDTTLYVRRYIWSTSSVWAPGMRSRSWSWLRIELIT